MTLRVCVLAEGEMGGGIGLPPAAGDRIHDDRLTSTHALVRRAIASVSRVPDAAIVFEAPLRTGRGRVAHGSDLLDRTRLRRLLTWPRSDIRPDLAVLLVDTDDAPNRKVMLRSFVSDLPISARLAIAAAKPELEAWLIADVAAIQIALPHVVTQVPPNPESLGPRAAKALLRDWITTRPDPTSPETAMRKTIAELARLDELQRHCRSFQDFLDEIVRALG